MITATKRQDWRTPRRLFNTLQRDYRFDIDAAASPQNALLPRYFTDVFRETLCAEMAFCNPPFSAIADFLEWGRMQVSSDPRSGIVFLLPANVDTRWYHEQVHGKGHVCLFRGRVSYDPPDLTTKRSSPSFPSMLVSYIGEARRAHIFQPTTRDAKTGEPLTW